MFVEEKNLNTCPLVETVQPDPFALSTLISWLERKDPSEKYCYLSNGSCLLAQYFQANGYPEAAVTAYHLNPTGVWGLGGLIKFPDNFNRIAVAGERTFGSALKRARSLL